MPATSQPLQVTQEEEGGPACLAAVPSTWRHTGPCCVACHPSVLDTTLPCIDACPTVSHCVAACNRGLCGEAWPGCNAFLWALPSTLTCGNHGLPGSPCYDMATVYLAFGNPQLPPALGRPYSFLCIATCVPTFYPTSLAVTLHAMSVLPVAGPTSTLKHVQQRRGFYVGLTPIPFCLPFTLHLLHFLLLLVSLITVPVCLACHACPPPFPHLLPDYLKRRRR